MYDALTTEQMIYRAGDEKQVWELRNMRSPLSAVRLDSPVNRLSLSSSNVIAIPHDNRHVRLYDLNGQRLARLPRNNRIVSKGSRKPDRRHSKACYLRPVVRIQHSFIS